MNEPICRRCGQCCYYLKDGVLKKCPFLVKTGRLTSCRIYANRLGTVIDFPIICGKREDKHENFSGCPYNKPEYEVTK